MAESVTRINKVEFQRKVREEPQSALNLFAIAPREAHHAPSKSTGFVLSHVDQLDRVAAFEQADAIKIMAEHLRRAPEHQP